MHLAKEPRAALDLVIRHTTHILHYLDQEVEYILLF